MATGNKEYDVLVVGGGAAGFFAAITCIEKNPDLSIAIIERGKDVLEKVRISGGGRCNVTHACFDPKELITHYPRGGKELLGPFHQFSCSDTIAWFENRGVKLKIEDDGRMFPITDNSETIAQCLIQTALNSSIKILTSTRLEQIKFQNEKWLVTTNTGPMIANKLFIGAGSSSAVWKLLEEMGHNIIPAVPSLFTFNIKDKSLHELAGLSVKSVEASIFLPEQKKPELFTTGPVLITHWGLSGPTILKLSAWGARVFHNCKYQFEVSINWMFPVLQQDMITQLNELKSGAWSKKQVMANSPFENLPLRLWKYLIINAFNTTTNKNWADLSKKELSSIARVLCDCRFDVNGKSTFKEEFVTAGGVSLKEVNLKTFESKITPGLYMAGEILDIDGVTGGFNFQAAWTGGYLAGKEMAEN